MDTPDDKDLLWRRRVVEKKTGLGTSTLYKLVRQGKFPKPRGIPGAPGIVAWNAAEVAAWADELPVANPHDRPAKGRPAAVEAGVE